MYLATTTTPTTMNIQGGVGTGIVNKANTSTVGILASSVLFDGGNFAPYTITGNASTVFNGWRTQNQNGSNNQYASRANVGPYIRNVMLLGYIDGPLNGPIPNSIGRQSYVQIDGTSMTTVDQAHCIDIGAGSIGVSGSATTGPFPRPVVELQSLV